MHKKFQTRWRTGLRSALTAAALVVGLTSPVHRAEAIPAPAWATKIQPGTWSAVLGENSANDVDPKRDADINPVYPATPRYEGNSGYKAIWEAWNSGAYAPSQGPCGSILYFGGGRDYRGNAIIALNLCGGSSGAPVWQRMANPYAGPASLPLLSGFPNGTPIPPNTFDLLSFDQSANALVLLTSQAGSTTLDSAAQAWTFDLDFRQWRGPFAHRGAAGGASAYDSLRRRTWFQPQQGTAGELTSFDSATAQFRYYGWPWKYGVGGLDSLMGYDPARDRLVLTSFRGASKVIAEHSLTAPTQPWTVAVQQNAPAASALYGQNAMAWSPSRKAWIVWMAHADASVYEVRCVGNADDGAPIYRWTKLTSATNQVMPVSSEAKASRTLVGSYEKFQLVHFDDGTEVLVGQLRLADGIFAFRLPKASSPGNAMLANAGSNVSVPVTVPSVPKPVTAPPVTLPTTPEPSQPAPTLRAQAAAIPLGHWANIAVDNSANAVDPALDPSVNLQYPTSPSYNAATGYRSVWEAWNSGAFAPGMGSCGGLLYFGGGHNDYWGNEVVALDLCGGRNGGPKWRRLSNPYDGPIQWPVVNGSFPNKTPAPPHTYDLLSFDLGSNSLVLLESAASATMASDSHNAWRFSLDTNQWSGPFAHRGAQEGVSTYDTRRRLTWFQPAQGKAGELTSFDSASGGFQYFGWPYSYGLGGLDSIMGYDADRDRLVLTSFRASPPVVAEHDLADPTSKWMVAEQVNAPGRLVGQNTLAWSKLRKAWIVWMAFNDPAVSPPSGGMVYEMRHTGTSASGRPQYTWRLLTAAGNKVQPLQPSTSVNGSFKKFQVVETAPGVEVLIGQLRVADGVMAFRIPPPGQEPATPTVTTAAPASTPPAPSGGVTVATNGNGATANACPQGTTCRSGEPNWASVCSIPGVFVCDNFGSQATLDGVMTAGNSMPRLDKGDLVFTIPSNSSANAGGEYRVTFPALGEGKFLAFSYRVKADAAALALPGRKEYILWRGASSCTDLQLVQELSYGSRIPVPYTDCGAYTFERALPGGDFLKQFPDYHCTYRDVTARKLDGCLVVTPDQWHTYYVEVQIGKYNQPNSHVTMWHKGADGVWKRYIDRDDFTFLGDGGFNQFMLTVYMTGKDRTVAHPPGEVRYDYLLMSTRPFSVDALSPQ